MAIDPAGKTLLGLLPYLASLTISLGVGLFIISRRSEMAGRVYSIVALSQASWTFGYICELVSPTLAGKIFWDNFQFIGGSLWAVAFLAFTIRYSGRKLARPLLTYALLSAVPVLIVLLAFSDPLHHLIRPAAWLVPGDPFSALLYDFTLPVWIWGIYSYILLIVCYALLIERFIHTQRLYRAQIGLVLLGNLIPAAGTLLTLSGVIQSPNRDISPMTFAIGNLIVALALYRFQLFELVPVARDAVVESMSDGVYIIDSQARIIDLNPAARRAIGRLDDDVIGEPAVRVFSRWLDLLQNFMQSGPSEAVEIIETTPDGPLYYEVTVQPILDPGQRTVGQFAISRDITSRRLAEEALKLRTAELEAANQRLQVLGRVKDEFVSNLSHELRTPLTSVQLYLDLLEAAPQNRAMYMPTLQREVERLRNMIESLLTLSRLDQRNNMLDFQPVDLARLVQEYVSDRVQIANSKGLELSFPPAENPVQIDADPSLIGQVLSILLTNATNYTPAGGHVTVGVLVSESPAGWAGFYVSDSGPGLQPDEQERLFTRFFRGKTGRASNISGTGLGLALAKEIIDHHHGRIEVNSDGVPGEGATFRVWLPVAQPPPDSLLDG